MAFTVDGIKLPVPPKHICLLDLSSLMQNTIAKGIVFMISQSGVPGYYYNIHFAKYIDRVGNRSVHLRFHESEGQIIQYADEDHSVIEFNDINSVLEYVETELNRKVEQGSGA